MAIPLIFVAGASAATALAAVIGWRAHDAVDDVTGQVNGAQNTVSTLHLLLYLAMIYAAYRFMKGLK